MRILVLGGDGYLGWSSANAAIRWRSWLKLDEWRWIRDILRHRVGL